MNSDSIDIEAGLKRDHDHRQILAVCRYVLAAIAIIVGAVAARCDGAGYLRTSLHEAEAQAAAAKAGLRECRRWTP